MQNSSGIERTRAGRQCIKVAVALALYYSGICLVYQYLRRRLSPPRLKILAFHSVDDTPDYINLSVTPAQLTAVASFLTQRFELLSMDDVASILMGRRALERDAVAITFDDGYRDNYEHAFPILRRFGIPATIYVTTECVDSGRPPAAYVVHAALAGAREAELDLAEHGLPAMSLRDWSAKRAAILALDARAKALGRQERDALVDAILAKVKGAASTRAYQNRMLSWEQVRELQQNGVLIGGHSLSHPVLAELGADELKAEVAGCKVRIEERTGCAIRHFAYPYGGPVEVTPPVVAAARDAGYQSAVLLEDRPLQVGKLWEIGRVLVGQEALGLRWGGFLRCLFACEMSGLFDDLRRLLRG
jgi:peptidoglycan/xylan/chitin deacetylase (PgdA/CDA1 family)